MTRLLRAVALSVLGLVALSGCIRYDIDMTVSDHDTASGTVILAFENGAGEEEGKSDDDLLAEVFGEPIFGEDFVESDYDADGWIGKKYVFTDVPIDELTSFADVFTITRSGDTYRLNGITAPVTEEGRDQLPENASSTLSITFPGRVTEHNGTVDGKTVTWDLFSQTEPLHAVAGAESNWLEDNAMALTIGVGAALLAVLAVVAVLFLRSRRAIAPAESEQDDDAEEGAEEGAEGDATEGEDAKRDVDASPSDASDTEAEPPADPEDKS